MYGEDSFFTLSGGERLGLMVLSALLAGLFIWVTCKVAAGRHVLLRLLAAFVAFAVFVWLSPQVYYGYYQILFEGLPWQVVIRTPDPASVVRQLLFLEGHNLSYHSRAVLGWVMIAVALLQPRLSQFLAR